MSASYRTNEKPITIGSCEAFISEWDGETVPDHATICVEANRFAYVKSGATITYTQTTVEVKDDLGLIKKTYLSEDGATVKLGLLGWVGTTLKKILSTARVTEADGIRKVKIGGVANDDGKKYVLCLHHIDNEDGDCWWTICGKNTEGLELSYAIDEGITVNPTFSAQPMDSDGTLVVYEEQINAAAGAKMLAFSVAGAFGTINEAAKTVAVTVPYGTAVTNLAASFEVSDGATVKVGSTAQVSGTTTNNFSSPVSYVVTSSDSSATATYVVTVTVAPNAG